MNQIVGVTQLKRHFKAIFDRVAKEKETLILTRDNQPEAVLIPYDQFVRFQQLQEAEVLERFDRLLSKMTEVNAGYSDEEIASDLESADVELQG
jgi:prevent-host-death family protein